MSRGGDIEGKIVPESEVANGLGFKSVEDFRAWMDVGGPTGRCSNPNCWRPAFWPDLEKPCKYCGSSITIEKKGIEMIQHEINARVNSVIAQALGLDDDEITATSHLINDLGAESIDFLDITFRLEREFGLKIPREELFPETIFRENPEYIKDGKITDEGVNHLKEALSYANDFENVEKKRTVDSVKNLFTVGLIYNYIDWKLKL